MIASRPRSGLVGSRRSTDPDAVARHNTLSQMACRYIPVVTPAGCVQSLTDVSGEVRDTGE
jgi:hypothetical protein